MSALEVIDGVGEVLPLARTTLEPGATVEVDATRLITAADLPGPLLHTIAVRGQAHDGQIVQVCGAATVQLAPPAASVIHLQPGARQTTQVGNAPLIVDTSHDFALTGVTASGGDRQGRRDGDDPRACTVALFAPEAAAPAFATHLYLPVIQRAEQPGDSRRRFAPRPCF